jgi:hypothetical protein
MRMAIQQLRVLGFAALCVGVLGPTVPSLTRMEPGFSGASLWSGGGLVAIGLGLILFVELMRLRPSLGRDGSYGLMSAGSALGVGTLVLFIAFAFTSL